MQVKQLLAAEIGKRTGGGFPLSIKTFKKMFQVGEDWYQQVILMDETGEIPADVKIGKKYNPLRGHGTVIKIIVCEVQEAEYLGADRRKLLVDQYTTPAPQIGEPDEPFYEGESDRVVRSKVKCLLVAAAEGRKDVTEEDYARINKHVEYIVK